ncbi:hypothetical protein ACF06X_34330 [Streptomyces sp. NPDC015346]|uniref:hypothetical protein n=1 Tax=Streptomyces sp. NPDC015346 TaxID=3364954 RepID=UPI0036FC0D8E
MGDPISDLADAAVEAPQSAIDTLTASDDPKTVKLGNAVATVRKAHGAFLLTDDADDD